MTYPRCLFLNTPEDSKPLNRDMAGGLGFDRGRFTKLPPLDMLSYASVLQGKGWPCIVLDGQVESSREVIWSKIKNFDPEIVVLAISLPSLQEDISFCEQLRSELGESRKILFKTGIPHKPILLEILQNSSCNYIIHGEGDLIIDQILSGKTKEGCSWLEEGQLRSEKERSLKKLDALPILKRELLPLTSYYYPRFDGPMTSFQTSRGCPFPCGYYCPYPLVQGKLWRRMSAERVLQELEEIVKNNKIENVLFRDATFTLNRKRTLAICNGIQDKKLELKWWCETRVSCLDEELLLEMKKAGCLGINIGVETGDEVLLSESGKPGTALSDILEISNFCKKIGIKLHFLLMLGLPGETKSSLFKTFSLVDLIQPESLGITTVTPYPGTPLHEDAIKNNWIINPDFKDFGGHGYNMRIDGLGSDELGFALEKIYDIYHLNATEDSVEKQKEKDRLYHNFKEWMNVIKTPHLRA